MMENSWVLHLSISLLSEGKNQGGNLHRKVSVFQLVNESHCLSTLGPKDEVLNRSS